MIEPAAKPTVSPARAHTQPAIKTQQQSPAKPKHVAAPPPVVVVDDDDDDDDNDDDAKPAPPKPSPKKEVPKEVKKPVGESSAICVAL